MNDALIPANVFPVRNACRARRGRSLIARQHVRAGRRRRRTCRRHGLTLFELLLALAIFLASVAALAHLLNVGSRAAIEGRLQSRAILRCETKLDEVLAGAEPMESAQDIPFEDDEDWRWSLEVQNGPVPGLVEIELSVSHAGRRDLTGTTFQLRRYVRHPEWFRSRVVRPAVRPVMPPPAEATVTEAEDSSAGDRDR